MEVAGMVDNGIGDYFISDTGGSSFEDDELIAPPVVVPSAAPQPAAAPAPQAPAPQQPVAQPLSAPHAPAPAAPQPAAPAPGPAPMAPQPAAPIVAPQPAATVAPVSREQQLASALDEFMASSLDVQASALVSLDGFTMASALPPGMQEDRVGAMSAAILGLGERAAAELGRGRLSQVFIEGDDGYVLLMAAGGRAVLTALAAENAKLGLVLYDMRSAAAAIGRILG